MSPRMLVRPIVLAGLFVSCASPLEVEDDRAMQLETRLLYRWTEAEQGKPWYGVDFELGGSEGDADQELHAGDVVVIGEQSFTGPAALAIDYDLRRAAVCVAMGGDTRELQALMELGLGWQELQLEVSQGVQRAQASDGWLGVVGAAEFVWTPTDWIGLEARAGLTTELEHQASDLELAAVLPARAPIKLLLGWRWTESYSYVESESNIELRLQGPVIVLRGGW